MAIHETIERLESELGELLDALGDSSRATELVRTAYEALGRVPAALEHDRYQDAVSAHQRLVLRGASEAEVHSSYERLMAQFARLPPE